MGFLKHFAEKLAGPLLLILGIVCVAGYFMLVKVNPPAIWPFAAIVVFVALLGGSLYVLDRQKAAAEGRAQELRDTLRRALPRGGESRDTWTRPLLRLPLEQRVFDDAFPVLESAVDAARDVLAAWHNPVLPEAVRANVFLPTSEAVRSGDVCNLVIPHRDPGAPTGLQRHVSGDELALAFRPNQGATGRAFTEKCAIGVLVNPDWLAEGDHAKRSQIERWKYVRLHVTPKAVTGGFEMTPKIEKLVSDEMTWLISMPLFREVGGSPQVIGVLNIDGLHHQLDPKQLSKVFFRVAPYAAALSGVLARVPMDRVAIFKFSEEG